MNVKSFGYDKDGNFVGMKRYGSSNNLADEFGYSYFSGTNRLQTIGEGLTAYNYTYDKNGNMTSDQLNRTGSIKYDHRNLMTDVRAVKTENGVFGPEDITYWTVYRYDEAGNRVRKTRYKYTGSEPDPIFDMTGDTPPWTLQSDEFYVRDISGKEIAIYSGSSLTQWNIWGLDNVGKINSDTTRNYYLKDHLGSIRVVLNSTNTVVSAQDYDAWGYQLENRSYNSTAMKYDFTGKERDQETSYDYFGARYYDSRIANWTSIDPLFEKHFDYSPYNYVLRNPQRYFDPEGKQEELLGPGYMLAKYYIDADNQRSGQIRDMNEDINANGLDMTQAIAKYGELATEKYGGNLQPTNIEFDLALLGGSSLFGKKSTEVAFSMSDKVATKIANREITESMISKTLEKGIAYTGHESGATTFILNKAIANKYSLVVGQNTVTGKITTAIKMRPKSVNQLLKRLQPLMEKTSKDIGFK